jgi:diguanylate cyclase (GGDEF)-like protein
VAPANRLRAGLAERGWPIAAAPGGHLTYLFAVDLLALVWIGIVLRRAHPSVGSAGVLALLIVMALAFEEGVSRAARLQLRMSSDLKRDMTSVWAVCGAVALRPASAVALLGSVVVYVWFRQQRPAGQPLHRKCFNAATALVGCLTAGLVLHSAAHLWGGLPWSLSGSVSVFVAIVVYTTVNRGLVTLALVSVGVRGRVLLGSRDDNLIEIATLCLGGLVALAVLHLPWLAVLVIAPMVTLQRGALVRELEMAATTDAKTGLLNAVAWEHIAQREISRARRDNYSVAVLIIDIDRFKLVNDRYGHLVGDTVLRGVGRCIAAQVREYDSVGRFGGEEFVAVLPEVDEVEALVVAERVRARVNDLRVSALIDRVADEADDLLAVSIGVACWSTDGDELSDVLHAADGALYRAKASGRNRVLLADRGTGESATQAVFG